MIDKEELAKKILALEGLDATTKHDLLELLNDKKKYGLVWEDKPEEVENRLREELPVLVEDKSKAIISEDKDAPNHILIEGDNLEALTALSYTHEGKIDVIYIDPPYNTGNKDFVYNDKFVDTEDEYRHSKWLSFMAKRLKIAKRLLSDNGVIFISIDDNEQAALQMLCNEIFLEKNHIGMMTLLSNPRGSQNSKFLSSVHEYVLMYCKSVTDLVLGGVEKGEENLSEFKEDDGDGKKYRLLGLRKRGGAWKREDRPNMFYPIYVNPTTNKCSLYKDDVYSIEVLPKRPTGELGRWTWGPDRCAKDIHTLIGRPINRQGENEAWDIFRKDYLEDESGEQKTTKLKTIWIEKDTNYQNARNELKEIFGNSEVFDYAKPTYIVKRLESIIYNSQSSTILDFFAGSGTTLHATMQLNAEDGGHRQCILVTNNENNICEEVTYERNKRVIKGYITPKGKTIDGLHNNTLRYYRTDFVGRENSQQNRRQLVRMATDLLCIKEDCYDEQTTFSKHLRFFTNNQKRMLVLYKIDLIPETIQFISSLPDGDKISMYVYSDGAYPYTDDFEDVLDKIELRAIPEAILNALRKVLPPQKVKKFETKVLDKEMQQDINQALANSTANDYKQEEVW